MTIAGIQEQPHQQGQLSKHEIWQAHIHAWETGERSQQAYCDAHDLSLNRFAYWRKRLKALHDNAPLRVIPVLRSTSSTAMQLHSPSGWRIEIPPSTSIDLLRAVIASLP